jgi:hypothetical protein
VVPNHHGILFDGGLIPPLGLAACDGSGLLSQMVQGSCR